MASLFAKMCPGSQETLEVAAKALLHAQLGCALLGTLGWQGTGYCAAIVALSAFGIAAIDLVAQGEFGKMVALRGMDIIPVDVKDAVSKNRTVDMGLYDIAKVFFG